MSCKPTSLRILNRTAVLGIALTLTLLPGKTIADGATCELGPLVFGDSVWNTGIGEFYKEYHPYRFRWNNSSKSAAIFVGKRFPLCAYGKRLAAAKVRFTSRKVSRIELLAYDEALDGKIEKADFEKLFNQIRDTIGIYSGEGNPGISVNHTKTGTRRELWVNKTTAFFLEYRYQSVSPQYKRQFRGDFIRLTTAPQDQAKTLRSEAGLTKNVARLRSLKGNVRRRSNAIYIDNIPISIQGEASSSEAATTEMLFNYLKMPIDQREIAATMGAESTKQGPFYPLRTALMELAPPRVFRRRVIREFDWNAWKRLVNDYNWSARLSNKPILDGKVGYNPDEALRKMNPESLKKALARDQTVTKFRRLIIENVSRGIPILWGVQLGIVEEEGIPLSYYDPRDEEELSNRRNNSRRSPHRAVSAAGQPEVSETKEPQWVGKHMRLITGYDAGTQEVIFSDPWGVSHQGKRMAIDDANAITLCLYVIQPIFN